MTPHPEPRRRTLTEAGTAELHSVLAGVGLWLDLGGAMVRVRTDSHGFAAQLRAVYGAFPFNCDGDWADVHADIARPRGLRRYLRPQLDLLCDGQRPFEPFPSDSGLPLFEWGCNWMLAHRLHDLLLLHAGALERDGLALILPATPGSGKSTLTAALSQRGWRLLSDEFGAFDPEVGAFRALLKPIALKNASIEVLHAFAPDATWGPVFPKTRKGRLSHMAATPLSVARRFETARPGAFVLPQWQAGAEPHWERIEKHVLFPSLAFNAFNYNLLGEVGFRAVTYLVRTCPAWRLVYSRLDDALAIIDSAWPEVTAATQRSPACPLD